VSVPCVAVEFEEIVFVVVDAVQPEAVVGHVVVFEVVALVE